MVAFLTVLVVVIVALLGDCGCLVQASMKIELSYSVSLLPPVTGKYFSGEVTKDQLLCFGNLDYHEDTYLESFLCMIQWRHDSDIPSKSCFGLWGTRNVVVEVDGSIEFVRLKKLPREAGEADKSKLEAEHWLYLSNYFESKPARETVSVNAEPIYICARSTLWGDSNTTSSFSLQFRDAFIRVADRKFTLQQTFVNTLVAFGMSLPIVSPIVGTFLASRAFYVYGLNFFIAIFSACLVILVSAPLMITSKIRRSTRAAFHLLYFSTGEVDDLSQRVWLLYQSFYLSSLIVCVGSVSSYILFSVVGIEREMRNDIIRVCLSVSAASFFYFFIGKLFPKFSRRYMWIPFSFYYIATVLRDKVNKESQDEVLLSIYGILIVSNMVYHEIIQISIIARVYRDSLHVLKSLLGVPIKASIPEGTIADPLDTMAPPIALGSSFTDAGNNDRLDHTIVYKFLSEDLASNSLQKIAMMAESKVSLSCVTCSACGRPANTRVLSLSTELCGNTVSLRVIQQCSRVEISTCSACDEDFTVYKLVDILKTYLSLTPSNISVTTV